MHLQGYKSLFTVADFYHYHQFCNLLWVPYFERKKQIALQQDPFRSLFDLMALLDLGGIYLFVFPFSNLREENLPQQRTTTTTINIQSKWGV